VKAAALLVVVAALALTALLVWAAGR